MLPTVLKGHSVFVDGRGYVGRSEEAQLPKLTRKVDAHRDGGMDGEIELDMGQEKLELMLTFTGFEGDLLAQYGRGDCPVTLRGSIEDEDGATSAVEVSVRGLVKEIDDGSWKAGEKGARKFSLSARYYRYRQAGRELIEIDLANSVYRVDGVDRLAERRRNLGL